MPVTHEAALDSMRDFGFSDMESRVYLALVEHGTHSGYALAKIIAKANSNTYTALEALERRGAVVAGEGSPRVYRAVPAGTLLDALRRTFDRQQERAKRELAALRPARIHHGSFRLQRVEQVLDCAHTLLARARKSALVDAFPASLEALGDDIARAAHRGVAVIVKAYAPATLEATRVVVQPNGDDVVASYAGAAWLNLSIDGSAALISLLEANLRGVRHAMWTQDRAVAWTIHCGFACEIAFGALAERAVTAPQQPLSDALNDVHELLFEQSRAYMDAGFKRGTLN